MIKLIASDMDGTLLNDKKQLPSDFLEVLDRLTEKGIHFAVSSGRTYSAIDHIFPEEYRGKMDYICDNGACVMLGEKPVSVTPLDKGTLNELLDACEEIGGLKILVCAAKGTYHLAGSDSFEKEIVKYYKNHIITDNLRTIDDIVYKVAVCDMRGTLTHGKPALDAVFGDRLNIQASGEIWMDIMASGISKGAALKKLQEHLGVTREETMAFGDYFNDVEMLNAAEWSFCMENGHPDVKKMCKFTAQSNNDCGVTKAIRKYALGEDI
jgi:hypothetical protein